MRACDWWDLTWNPVGGCKPISPGCVNCFAARDAGTWLAQSSTHTEVGLYDGITARVNGRYFFNGKLTAMPEGHPRWSLPLWPRVTSKQPLLGPGQPLLIAVCITSDLFYEARHVAFCVDLDRKEADKDGIETWNRLVAEHGPVPKTRSTDTPSTGRHLFFKHRPGYRNIPLDKLAPGIEIKAEGGYVIGPPSRLANGREYKANGCAEIAEAPLWLQVMMEQHYKGRHHPQAAVSHDDEFRREMMADIESGIGIGEPNEPPSREQLQAALDAIPSDSEQIWFEIGCALHHELGSSGYPLFAAWSAKSHKYNSKDCAKKWHHCGEVHNFSVGTIFHYASAHDPEWWTQIDETVVAAPEPTPANQRAPAQPSPASPTPKAPAAKVAAIPKPASHLIIKPMSGYEMEPVEWLWPQRFAIGTLSLIVGDPDEGKSQIAANVEARVTRGRDWPNNEGIAPKGSVIILAAEDDIKRTIRPRFEAAGGDATKAHIVEAVHLQNRDRGFNLAEDIAKLERAIVEIKDVRLVRFDPLTAYLGKPGGLDSYRESDIRSLLTPLALMAERQRVAVIGLMHLAKTLSAKARLSAIGSIGFSAASRSVYLAVPDPETPDRKLFLKAKNNLTRANIHGLAYRFEERQVSENIKAPVVEWCEERITMSADEALQASRSGGRKSEVARAMAWLRAVLNNGPRAASTLELEGEAAGFTEKVIRVARERLNVASTKGKGKGAGWEWALPDVSEQVGQEDLPY